MSHNEVQSTPSSESGSLVKPHKQLWETHGSSSSAEHMNHPKGPGTGKQDPTSGSTRTLEKEKVHSIFQQPILYSKRNLPDDLPRQEPRNKLPCVIVGDDRPKHVLKCFKEAIQDLASFGVFEEYQFKQDPFSEEGTYPYVVSDTKEVHVFILNN